VIRLRRNKKTVHTSEYITLDGRFRVWKELLRPYHWYINEKEELEKSGWSDSLTHDGLTTLRECREFIEELYR
jgi:hypothetical protein